MGFRILLTVFILVAAGIPSAAAPVAWTETWERAMAGAAAAWPAGSDSIAARKLYRKALEEVMQHGPGTLRHARTLDELAYLNLMAGAVEQAESLYLESIPMLEKLLGPD